jgi:hypothetical protein
MNRFFWIGIEIACGLLFAVLLVSFPVLERGTPTYVVWWLAAGHLALAMTIIGGFIYFDWDPVEAVANR